jgi:hypothetical protein
LATAVLPTNLVEVIASEMAAGVDRAVECWMSQIDHALTDVNLTSLGRLNAVREILNEYKHLTGKAQLQGRRSADHGSADCGTAERDLLAKVC